MLLACGDAMELGPLVNAGSMKRVDCFLFVNYQFAFIQHRRWISIVDTATTRRNVQVAKTLRYMTARCARETLRCDTLLIILLNQATSTRFVERPTARRFPRFSIPTFSPLFLFSISLTICNFRRSKSPLFDMELFKYVDIFKMCVMCDLHLFLVGLFRAILAIIIDNLPRGKKTWFVAEFNRLLFAITREPDLVAVRRAPVDLIQYSGGRVTFRDTSGTRN